MVNLRKYNNYDYSDVHIDHILDGMRRGTLTAEEEAKYIDFDIVGGNLVYLPLDLICCKTSQKNAVITNYYNNFNMSLGAGIKNLYHKIARRYLGINRIDVENFLQGKTGYQLTKTVTKKTTNMPQLAKYSNHKWSCDLIDVETYAGHNRGRKYILTVIDHFSRYCFATPLLNKTAQAIIDGFNEIHTNQSHIWPEILISDNGGELKNARFEAFCAGNHITHLTTMSHSPKQNALIENFNGNLRKIMANLFVRTNDLNWIDHLQEMLDSRNNTVHSVTKSSPAEIWRPVINRVLNLTNQGVKDKLDNKARADITRTLSNQFAVGDAVRILLSAIETRIRKRIKDGEQKKSIVKYSPTIYFVDSIIQPNADKVGFQQLRYTLVDDADVEVWDDDNRPMKFYGSDLQKVPAGSANLLTVADANRLNKI